MVSAAVFRRQIDAAAVLAGQLAQFHVSIVEHARELLDDGNWAADGIRSPQHWLQVYFALSPAQALGIVKVAQRREAMDPVLDMMRQGRLSLDQAMVIATHTPDDFVVSVTNMAEFTTVVQLRRVLSMSSMTTTSSAPSPNRSRRRRGLNSTATPTRMTAATRCISRPLPPTGT